MNKRLGHTVDGTQNLRRTLLIFSAIGLLLFLEKIRSLGDALFPSLRYIRP
jgi:hypothetical protein